MHLQAVPFFFDPVVIENGKDKSSSMLVDGGMVSNFPIGFLPSSKGVPTFGVLLSERTPFKDAANIKNFINVGESLVNFLENFYDDASLANPEVTHLKSHQPYDLICSMLTLLLD